MVKEKFFLVMIIDNIKKEVKDKLVEVEKIIVDNVQVIVQKEKYEAVVKVGSDFFVLNKFFEVKKKFEEVFVLDFGQVLLKDKIREIDVLIVKVDKEK